MLRVSFVWLWSPDERLDGIRLDGIEGPRHCGCWARAEDLDFKEDCKPLFVEIRLITDLGRILVARDRQVGWYYVIGSGL